ncbi:hypothetical protein Zmor_027191 [Zophobas morio]|uniref:peptidylglycine monooxygenase n=2 Tax=Zophobas morio TaxID=2755281 RepID=A0AA38HNM9_9CUCU|nr:hypothetical protein Zmor_027191 [Zophobas morio]
MPNVHPDTEDSTFCTSQKLNSTIYLVAFEPKASLQFVHHLLVFGCSKPGSVDPYWNCGETKNPCGESIPKIIYSWALNATPFHLPKNVAFKVGPKSQINYLVLQIHYTHNFHKNQTDISGLNLMYTKKYQNKLAGILALASEGLIPPRTITTLETLCQIKENKTIFPFAFRVHTHELGKLVSGYSTHKDGNGVDHWFLLGKKNPQEAQLFCPVVNRKPVTFGDKLMARCTMDSRHKGTYTIVGPGHDDEMCNFYIAYYVEKGTPLRMSYCISTRV